MTADNNNLRAANPGNYVKQHLIDPLSCARCGSCEYACPEEAISMAPNGQNYVVDPERCSGGHECLYACSTEAINAWRMVPEGQMYSLEEQYAWEELPAEVELDGHAIPHPDAAEEMLPSNPPPASASVAITFLHTQKNPLTARIKHNSRVTVGESEVHHIVLDVGDGDFPWLEGQNIGVLPPGNDPQGHPHHMRAYSIASDRDGETRASRELALTVKRVVDEWEGQPYHGVASNFLCDLEPGDEVRCIGPMGEKFLMPQDPEARLLMICTGTGIAPMRGFIQRQQRINPAPHHPLQLVYGGRTRDEMAYLDELEALPASLVETRLALSREAAEPKRYVQDLLRERAAELADFLAAEKSYIFICGLVAMEQAVLDALAHAASLRGLDTDDFYHRLLLEGRLQVETY
ncbi:4Fe-4S binding protein [Haliea sp. E17]|uniref:4Fe-4S binding protein n=1 Tax=Haliea sp. E17 TaxID=3401576 RepID=UPI003AAFDCDD